MCGEDISGAFNVSEEGGWTKQNQILVGHQKRVIEVMSDWIRL